MPKQRFTPPALSLPSERPVGLEALPTPLPRCAELHPVYGEDLSHLVLQRKQRLRFDGDTVWVVQ